MAFVMLSLECGHYEHRLETYDKGEVECRHCGGVLRRILYGLVP